MTVPFTEPVQNFTEFSLWEILDIKKANFSVSSFDILDEAYEDTPLKFAERTIVQLGSEPKRIRYYDESANFTEDNYYPSNEPNPFRDAAPLDHVESINFDENKVATLDNPEDKRYMFVDVPNRIYSSGDVNITLDSSKPVGVVQLENTANYNWDYPELIIRVYVDNENTYLGGFRIPYGFGAIMKYNLDNKDEYNLSKGYWTWSMFVVDWSIVQKVASSEGQFASVETAYLGLFGDEGESDERLFYPVMLKQDVNGWTQFEFTANMQFKSKNKDTGVVGDKVLEIQPSKVVHHKQPYYGDDKLATRTNNNISNTASFNDLIHSSGQTINEWIAANEGYEPSELLDAIFDSKVLGSTNWICSATTSGNNYNGTFPTSYQQVEIHKTGGSSRNFMRAYNKESQTHYFAPYKSGEDPVWKTYTYAEDIPDIIDVEIQPLEERVTNLETGGDVDKNFSISPFKFSEAPSNGYTQSATALETQRMVIRSQVVDVVKIPDATKGAIAFGVTLKNNGRFWMGFHAELIGELIGLELMNKRPNLGIVIDTSKFNPCLKQGGSTPSTGIMNWEGVCIPKGMDANDDNPARYIMPDGSQTTVKADAFTREYMGWNLNQRDNYVDENDFTEDWKFRLSRGYIADNGVFIPEESSPYYYCRMGMEYTYSISEVATLSFIGGTFSIYQTPAGAIADREPKTSFDDVANLIDDNNFEIINPTQGSEFQFTDSAFSVGYGKEGQLTYYAPADGETQNEVLTSHLDTIRAFVLHRSLNTTRMFLMLHEDYVSELYNKDVSNIDQLTMLFGTKSKGRFGKSNQTAPEGSIWNWNGDAVPSDVDPNALNPGKWTAKEGGTTTTWDRSKILNACYSTGGLYNDGSATLTRGDVSYDKATETTAFTARSDSEFFVLPIRTGGGTFSAMKIFPFFMDRYQGTQNEWDSYTFNNLADCVGTILKIAYDAAVELEGSKDEIQTELFKMAAATVAEYPDSNFVIKTED